ncbi:MAG TPA: cysteine desulfurase [Anaerolineales bacterium]|nr:cysteine desulfurase [Anaerolineales bacterium]
MIQIENVRADFPVLERELRPGKRLIYLDSAASSQKPLSVINTMDNFYRLNYANIHRGVHQLAEESTEMYESARAKVARFIGAKKNRQVIFTRNTTESINLVAHSWGRMFLKAGDLVLLTQMEHHSNIVPWQILKQQIGIEIDFVNVTLEGQLDMADFKNKLAKEPKLVSFTHMSNVLGTINPAKEIIRLAHLSGAVTLVDGAQSVPHFPVNVEDLDADFLAFSSHKMLGPTGIGVLYGKLDLLNQMDPFLGGGDMIKEVRFDGFSSNELPHKFEAGTPAIAEAIGLGTAVEFLEEVGLGTIVEHENELLTYALDAMHEFKDLQILNSKIENKGGVIAFYSDKIHPHDMAQLFDREGIAIRAGHHCAQPLHTVFNVPATARASFYLYNNREEIDQFIHSLHSVINFFK